MNSLLKLTRPIFYSLLFMSVVCESFIIIGCNLKRTEPGDLQGVESDNPREALKKAIYAAQNVKSFRTREAETSSSNADATVISEFVAPDRFHIIFPNEEMISVGGKVYRKEEIGPWKRFPEEGSVPTETIVVPSGLERDIEEIEKAEDVKLIGRDTLDGIPTLVYQYTFHNSDKTYSSITKTWIAVADGLKRREESTYKAGSNKGTKTSTYYDYNADIKIEPPDISTLNPAAILDPQTRPNSNVSPSPGDASREVDAKPVPLNTPSPRYTEQARKNKVQGTVIVKVLVGVDGLVKQVRITRGLPDGLDEQAIRAAYQLRFRPAMKNGQPAAFWQVVQIEFHL